MHQNSFLAGLRPDPAGELTTLPHTPSLSRLGWGYPFPIPLDAFGASMASGASIDIIATLFLQIDHCLYIYRQMQVRDTCCSSGDAGRLCVRIKLCNGSTGWTTTKQYFCLSAYLYVYMWLSSVGCHALMLLTLCLELWRHRVAKVKQVRKVLWTRKAPAYLLTLLYAYGKPRLCINIHHYAPPPTVLQQAEHWIRECAQQFARNSSNSWPLYARWSDQPACFG